jgi:hypothetical protein
MFLNVSFNFATAISKYDTFSSYHIIRTRIAKVTNFFPFCPIGISMYQKLFLPYFIIPSTFSPQASSPLSHHRQTEGQTNFKGCYLPTIDRGIRTTSRQISFEFLFIKTRPHDKLHNGFGFVVQFRVGIRYAICQGGEF